MNVIRRENAVLAVVDMQERLLNAFEPERRATVVQRAGLAIDAARVLGLPVLVTEQYPKGLGRTVQEIRERLPEGTTPVEKLVFSCSRCEEFRTALDGTHRRDVVLCGVEAHVCVLQTAVDLLREGFRVLVPADAVASRRTLDWRVGLELMRHAGAVVGTTEIFLFQLLERAGTDEFKQIARLVK